MVDKMMDMKDLKRNPHLMYQFAEEILSYQGNPWKRVAELCARGSTLNGRADVLFGNVDPVSTFTSNKPDRAWHDVDNNPYPKATPNYYAWKHFQNCTSCGSKYHTDDRYKKIRKETGHAKVEMSLAAVAVTDVNVPSVLKGSHKSAFRHLMTCQDPDCGMSYHTKSYLKVQRLVTRAKFGKTVTV